MVVFWLALFIILVTLFIIYYKKFKKTNIFMLSIPYVLILIITPLYVFLDQTIFVDVLGCGCVKGFNANNLRLLVYSILGLVMLILGVLNLKRIKTTKEKIVYMITITILNSFLVYKICEIFRWL